MKQKMKNKTIFSSLVIGVLFLFSTPFISFAATTHNITSTLGGVAGDFFEIEGTLIVDSIKVGKQGVGGVTFFNGTIVNSTTDENGNDNPITFGDNVRIDGSLYRTEPGGDNPMKIEDTIIPATKNTYSLGTSSNTFKDAFFSGTVTLGALSGAGIISTEHITNSAITTSKIANDAVTANKIADNAVTSSQITNSAITTSKIADDAITAAKVADGAITTSSILDGTITAGDLADGVIGVTVEDGSITTAKLADNSVTSAKIISGVIIASDIADNAITSDKILSATITSSDLAVGAVSSSIISNGVIATEDIADNAITGAKITAGAVENSDLATDTVTLGTIDDDTITNADLNSSAGIALSKLQTGSNGQMLIVNPEGILTLTTIAGGDFEWISTVGQASIRPYQRKISLPLLSWKLDADPPVTLSNVTTPNYKLIDSNNMDSIEWSSGETSQKIENSFVIPNDFDMEENRFMLKLLIYRAVQAEGFPDTLQVSWCVVGDGDANCTSANDSFSLYTNAGYHNQNRVFLLSGVSPYDVVRFEIGFTAITHDISIAGIEMYYDSMQ